MKIQFGVTAMLHATGEAEVTDKDQMVFIHPVKVVPVLVYFSPVTLTPEQIEILRAMTLHQLVKCAVEKVIPTNGLKQESDVPINMNPESGDKN